MLTTACAIEAPELDNAWEWTTHNTAMNPSGQRRTVEDRYLDRVLYRPGKGREFGVFSNDGADLRVVTKVRPRERYQLFGVTARVDAAQFTLTSSFREP